MMFDTENVPMLTGSHSIRARIEQLLEIRSASKPEVYLQVFDAAEILSLNYALELLFSAGIATLGLVLNSPAVVIGAMLISPLMGPILAAGLALAAADLYLGVKSLLTMVLSVACAILLSAFLVWLLPFHTPTGEILARTQPNLLDLGVALLSGLAGSIVVCRGGSGGGVTALPGVAIAVALMPPLCTVGFGVGAGFSWQIISGAGLLFLTNLAAIIASAFFVFYIVRMDAPDIRMKIDYSILERASRDRLYLALQKTRMAKAFGDIGKLRWRALMLVSVLVILFVPLRQSLYQLRDETVSRAAAEEAIRSLAARDNVVSRVVDIASDRIAIQLTVTAAVDPARIQEAERQILRRTGKDASITCRKVASDEELAVLRERLRTPAPPTVRDLDSIRAEVLPRLEVPLKELWPSEAAELLGYEVGFTSEGTLVRARFRSDKEIDPVAMEVLSKALQSRLTVNNLRLVLEREPVTSERRRRAR